VSIQRSRGNGERVRQRVGPVLAGDQLGRQNEKPPSPLDAEAGAEPAVPTAARPHRTVVERKGQRRVAHDRDLGRDERPTEPCRIAGESRREQRCTAQQVGTARDPIDELRESHPIVPFVPDRNERLPQPGLPGERPRSEREDDGEDRRGPGAEHIWRAQSNAANVPACDDHSLRS